jgi:glucose/arabinose dehydrogenase
MPSFISIDSDAIRVDEEALEVIIPIIRTESGDNTSSIDYSINDGTATATEDFTATSGTLTFESGETSQQIVVPIVNDEIPEIDETFNIAIGNANGAELGENRTTIVTIVDDDADDIDALAFSQGKYNFSEEQQANVTVVRTGNREGTVSVDYASNDEYAREGSDYTTVSGTLTFAPGETSKTFTIPLLDDDLSESDEAIGLSLSNPVGIELGPQENAQLIVEDNDESPFVFDTEIIVSGLNQAVAFDWASDERMLIATRDGRVRVVDNEELLEQPFLDISSQVNISAQRGLLGFAVHPEFSENPYIYLAFSYDPPEVEKDLPTIRRPTRLIRVTADPDTDYTTAIPGSEVVLLETPPVKDVHAAGAIRFGNDGSLFFSHGDGSPVGGPTTLENAELLQSLDNPFGKLLRIDPITGEGYSENPFYDGDSSSIQSKIYNYGLRNPWRYTFHPETGEPYIGDVGWTGWEEINTGRGVNFGWPLYEGGNGESLTTRVLAEDPEFQELYDSVSDLTAPIYALSHDADDVLGDSIVLGDFYTGTNYPELYQDALFFTDFYGSEVYAMLFDEDGNIDSVTSIAEKERGVTQISMGPDENLYFSNLGTGEVGRWVFDNEPLDSQTIELFRFRDTTSEAGTYLFVGVAERDDIQNNPDFSDTFELEGDGNSAFTASTTERDDLLPFYRLRSLEGTYLFVGRDEYDAIFNEDSNQRNKWVKEGLNGEEDIPEFYLYGVGAGEGIEFHRFQNNNNGSYLFAGPQETAAINNDSDLSATFTDQGVAFESLI